MRCKNCGWDNSGENTKCEKCNAPLSGSMVDSRDLHDTNGISADEFDPKKTSAGCPDCGYPLKPTDRKCPNCGCQLKVTVENEERPYDSSHKNSFMQGKKMRGTVIGGNGIGNDDVVDSRKLVGFLVTYSLDSNGLFFPLYEGRNFIGRDSSTDICIQGDNKISGKHFSILYRSVDRKFKFKDEQSSNGTFINEKISDEGELTDHDIIQIGSTRLILMIIPE
jgi:ribosomal protein L34E